MLSPGDSLPKMTNWAILLARPMNFKPDLILCRKVKRWDFLTLKYQGHLLYITYVSRSQHLALIPRSPGNIAFHGLCAVLPFPPGSSLQSVT